jgi:hypothetical protein
MSVNNSCKLTNRNNLFNNAVPVFVRFVGWLKNFIHNRSLASENLMRGYNTTCMVRHMPPQALAALRSRVVNAPSYTKAGVDRLLPMPSRRLQGGKKGSGVVTITPSRRNRKRNPTANWPKLRARLAAYMRMGWLARQPIPSTVYVMRIGVKINGRDWPGGSFCRYTRDTRANRGNTHMGKIVLYYTFENGLPTFVLIDSHHIKEQKGVMFVVDTIRSDQHVVHIDCLTFLYHLAPINVGDDPAVKCALPVAPAYPTSLNLPLAQSL